MSGNPCIVFCITCKGRVQHVEQTLPQNIRDNADYANLKFVLLDYNSQDYLQDYLQHGPDIKSGRLVAYHFPSAISFKMAHAKNMAHRLGIEEGADILVNLDADNFTGPGFASYIAEQFKTENIFLWARMIKDGAGRLPKGISGRIVVSKESFINVGGYDERFETWSPDDKDFSARLRRIGYEAREIDNQYLRAILHNDKLRFREYRQAQENVAAYEFDLVHQTDTTIVNYGDFGCGTVYRNYGNTPLVLAPIPTRIFGIGMHKTATTSLHAALTQLGIQSAHWKTAHWAKAIWTEMTTLGRSKTLEKSYALSDLPVGILYQELDRAYPGSKFILTIRNEKQWLKSVKNHWSWDHNPFRKFWDTDPFTHKIHKLVYGQKGFDATLFIARYRRHNADAKEYFKYRPNDLLVMDMNKGNRANWKNLCKFLGKPVPDAEYPREFATVSPPEKPEPLATFKTAPPYYRRIIVAATILWILLIIYYFVGRK